MKTVLRRLGVFLVFAGLLLCLAGLASLPSGGLMFALPYVFLMPGGAFVVIGSALFFLSRKPGDGQSGPPGG